MISTLPRRIFWAGLAMALAAGGASARAAGPPPNQEVFVRAHGAVGESRAPSARARGMGGAYAALVNGAGSIQENPAALGAMCGKSVALGLAFDGLEDGNGTTDVTTFNIGGAFSLNAYLPTDSANQAVGIAYKSASLDGPSDTATGSLDDAGITASYGRTFGPNLLGGVSVSVVDGSWTDGPVLATAGGFDDFALNSDMEYTGGEVLVGGLYRLSDTMTLGGVASYATGRARLHSHTTDAAPDVKGVLVSENGDFSRLRARGGVAWQAAEQTLVTGDLEYAVNKFEFDSIGDSESKMTTVMGGVEQELLPEALVLRGGIYGRRENFTAADATHGGRRNYKEDYWGFTAGVGARVKAIDLNYTLDIRTTGDIGHVLGVQYDW